MRTSHNFGILYITLVIIQILICNFINMGSLIVLSILPVLILCMPLAVSTALTMVIAFVTGLCVDWLSEGLIGINALSLVPVALARTGIIQLFLGKDHIVRKDNFSIRQNGIGKVSIAVIASQAIFLVFYIAADGAGTRPLLFNALKFTLSLFCGYLLSILVANILTSNDKK